MLVSHCFCTHANTWFCFFSDARHKRMEMFSPPSPRLCEWCMLFRRPTRRSTQPYKKKRNLPTQYYVKTKNPQNLIVALLRIVASQEKKSIERIVFPKYCHMLTCLFIRFFVYHLCGNIQQVTVETYNASLDVASHRICHLRIYIYGLCV